MAKKNEHITANEIFVIRRSFDASRHLLCAAFTDPEHLMRWWTPKGFTMVYCKRDLRPGGMFQYCALSATGKAVWGRFVYRKIQERQRIAFTHSFLDEQLAFPGWPQETIHEILFTEQEGKTIMKFSIEAIDEEKRNFLVGYKLMKQNCNESFDQLEYHLAGPMTLNKIA